MKIDINPDWWKTLFDDIYLLTDARSVGDNQITRQEVDVFSELLPLRKSDLILDLCGGHGRHSLELYRRGFQGCTVLDFSETLLERGRAAAAERGCTIGFIQGDATATGLPEAGFDHVLILGNSLGYLPQATDDLRILNEANRLLKPGGGLLIDVTDGSLVRSQFKPNAWHEIDGQFVVCRERELDEDRIRAREVVICKDRGLIRDRNYAIRIYDPEGLSSLVKAAGFTEVITHRGFSPRSGTGDYGFMNHRVLTTALKKDKKMGNPADSP